MRYRLFLFAGFLISLYMVISLLRSNLRSIEIGKDGVPILVEVVDRPVCGKTNKIKVIYKEKEYSVFVSKNSCIGGKYYVGKEVEVIYSNKVDGMIMPSHNNDYGYYLCLFFFLIPLLFFTLLVTPEKYLNPDK